MKLSYHSLPIFLTTATVAITTTTQVYALPSFVPRIPNGAKVPGVPAVGHADRTGDSGDLDAFGKAFLAAGNKWTPALCKADSDGDGQTNGEELGDPCCTWTADGTPKFTAGVSSPGDASSKVSASVLSSNSCSAAPPPATTAPPKTTTVPSPPAGPAPATPTSTPAPASTKAGTSAGTATTAPSASATPKAEAKPTTSAPSMTTSVPSTTTASPKKPTEPPKPGSHDHDHDHDHGDDHDHDHGDEHDHGSMDEDAEAGSESDEYLSSSGSEDASDVVAAVKITKTPVPSATSSAATTGVWSMVVTMGAVVGALALA